MKTITVRENWSEPIPPGEYVRADVARKLYAACKGFAAAMRRAENVDLLWLIDALHVADAAIEEADADGD